jgi:hypothetical protein
MSTQALDFAGATKEDVAAAKAAVDRQILVAESEDTGVPLEGDSKDDAVTDGAFATAGPSLAAAAIALFALGCN